MVRAIPERFWDPYYAFNVILPLCYVVLRIKRLEAGELGLVDPFGFTREHQIYFSLGLMLFVRTLSAATIDAYLASAFMFIRVAILVCLWMMADVGTFALFLALWTVIYVVYPQPRFKHPSSVLVLNAITFDQRIPKSSAKTINVVWFHATWSTRCTQFAPVLADLAEKYRHVRLRFCKIDLSRWPAIADKYNISMAASSVQLPTVICFVRGVETARIPSLDDVRDAPNKWRRGFTAAHVAQELDLPRKLVDAERWEADARRRYRESEGGRPKNS